MAQTQTNTPTPVYVADELRDVAMLLDDLRERVNPDDKELLHDLMDSVIMSANFVERRMDA